MANISDVIDASDVRLYSDGVATGFTDLDECTGGLLPGAVWLVLGTPGVGRTIFACSLAVHAAVNAGVQTSLVLGREPDAVALLNFYCQLARVSAARIQRGAETADELSRIDRARELLRTAPLSVWSNADRLMSMERPDQFKAMFNAVQAGEGSGRVIVVDDYDDFDALEGNRGVAQMPARLRALRASAVAQQSTVVLTMPEEKWIDDEQARPELRRGADVVLRILRDDLYDPDGPRAGEVDLQLLRNRTGPNSTITLAFQGRYRRFVGMIA